MTANNTPRDILIGTLFLATTIAAIMATIVYMAATSAKMDDCVPSGGKIIYAQGRNVCLSKELLEQLRREENEEAHAAAPSGHSH